MQELLANYRAASKTEREKGSYLINQKRKNVVRLFYRRLLGYRLGRSVSISDEVLLDQMMKQTHDDQDGVVQAVMMIVQSPQFRMIRGAQSEPKTK